MCVLQRAACAVRVAFGLTLTLSNRQTQSATPVVQEVLAVAEAMTMQVHVEAQWAKADPVKGGG